MELGQTIAEHNGHPQWRDRVQPVPKEFPHDEVIAFLCIEALLNQLSSRRGLELVDGQTHLKSSQSIDNGMYLLFMLV